MKLKLKNALLAGSLCFITFCSSSAVHAAWGDWSEEMKNILIQTCANMENQELDESIYKNLQDMFYNQFNDLKSIKEIKLKCRELCRVNVGRIGYTKAEDEILLRHYYEYRNSPAGLQLALLNSRLPGRDHSSRTGRLTNVLLPRLRALGVHNRTLNYEEISYIVRGIHNDNFNVE